MSEAGTGVSCALARKKPGPWEEGKHPAAQNSPRRHLPARPLRRRAYTKLFRTILYVGLYVLILFLQRNPTRAFQVYNSLHSLVQQHGDRTNAVLSEADVVDWLQGAPQSSRANLSGSYLHSFASP